MNETTHFLSNGVGSFPNNIDSIFSYLFTERTTYFIIFTIFFGVAQTKKFCCSIGHSAFYISGIFAPFDLCYFIVLSI